MAKQPNRRRAAAASPAGATTESASAPLESPRDRAVNALLALGAERDWDEIRLTDIAELAGLSLADLRDLFPSKGAMLGAFARRIDRVVLEGTNADLASEPVRERVFDVMMRRLDALSPYRDSLVRIRRTMPRDPLTLAALNQLALNTHRYMLEAAGVDTEGPLGAVKIQGAVLVFARVMDVWLTDDDPGLARTMAALDRELRRGGQVITGLSNLCRLSEPFRAVAERVAARGRSFRERRRAPREAGPDDDDTVLAV